MIRKLSSIYDLYSFHFRFILVSPFSNVWTLRILDAYLFSTSYFSRECAKLRASHAFVPTCLHAHVLYVPSCLCFVHSFIFLCALRAFIFYVPYVSLFLYVPYLPPFFTCCHLFTYLTSSDLFTCLTCRHYFASLHFFTCLAFILLCLHFIYTWTYNTNRNNM